VHAVEPLMRANGGVWVAQGQGSADRAATEFRDGLRVPAEDPRFRLRRVWLEPDEVRGYYDGFANEALWPLCHQVHTRPIFRPADFEAYWTVNSRFAWAVHEEAVDERPIVFVQDYHLALAPMFIRERLPQSTIATFWHIPWPHWRSFEICPWSRQLVLAMLESNLVGFQTPTDCANFLEAAARVLHTGADHDEQAIDHDGRRVVVRAYPASIAWPHPVAKSAASVSVCRERVFRELGLPAKARLVVSVDRLDYTKGIEEKLLAIERLLESHPELRGTLVFTQLAEPSRDRLPAYRALRARVLELIARINGRFGTADWCPLVLREGHHTPEEVYRFLRAADVCYVGSLHDGMNLVSKEFVSARDDEAGVLILSTFAGAAWELRGAIIVNPYDLDECAQALVAALAMRPAEQRDRMRHMRAHVAAANAHNWGVRLLAEARRYQERPQSSILVREHALL